MGEIHNEGRLKGKALKWQRAHRVPFGPKKVEISGPIPSNGPRNGFPPHPNPYVQPHIKKKQVHRQFHGLVCVGGRGGARVGLGLVVQPRNKKPTLLSFPSKNPLPSSFYSIAITKHLSLLGDVSTPVFRHPVPLSVRSFHHRTNHPSSSVSSMQLS
jgi:hypothetical protein